MDTQQVTDQIMAAWDELEADEAEPVDEVEAEVAVEEEEPETEVDEGGEDEVEDEPEEEEEEGEDEGEEEEPAEEEPEAEPDPEIQAFLAKYNGDVDEALRGAAELQRVLGRQGQEKGQLSRRVEELEEELTRMQTLSTGGGPMVNEEQREWIEEAVGSPNPGAYVNGALQQGEFHLARAVCREWARDDPYNALRAASMVDQVEQQAIQGPAVDGPVDTGILLNVLAQNYPEMRQHEADMIATLGKLGEGHPLVRDAQSGDLERAAAGILGIYEIARASSTSVRAARDGVKKRQRQAGDDVRQAAQVSSTSASPPKTEKPRSVQLGPGLTLEDLEAEFARQ